MDITISSDQRDALTELFNIGIGRAANVLNEMLNERIGLSIPYVELADREKCAEILGLAEEKLSAVHMDFRGSFSGTTAIVFPPQSAANLVAILMGEDEESEAEEMDAIRASTLSEVGNIVINSVLGSITNVLKERLDYEQPKYVEDSLDNILGFAVADGETATLIARAHFFIKEKEISGDIIITFSVDSLDRLLGIIDSL